MDKNGINGDQAAETEGAKAPTLYEKVGGVRGVDDLVESFYDRVLGDPMLAPFFESTDQEKLRQMQKEFFAAALDGPIEYAGLTLAHAHHGRGIERRHFARFVHHLLETLNAAKLDERQISDIIERVNTYVADITGSVTPAG